jgi:benzoylformate decarboxylase
MTRTPKTSGTVQEIVFEVLRSRGMTTVFGNPGSTELNFLTNWPEDFRYILCLQEASALAMADGYAQATGNAAYVNLHSAAGVGNALGNLFTAYRNHTPLVVTAGQQERSMLMNAPYLGADRATEFPRPYVKWSIEPARAEDVPLAVAQAYEIAMQHPRGPVFVSIPSEDWKVLTTLPNNAQSASGAIPNPGALAELAAKMQRAKNLALVVGSSIDCDGAFDLAVQLAERSGATVWEAPVSSRASFPEDHPRFAGFLPAIPDSLSEKLKPYDLIVVIGAPVFTFHVPGEASFFSSGVPIYQITQDPAEAAHSSSATSLFGSMNLSMKALLDLLPKDVKPAPARPAREPAAEVQGTTPISIEYAIQSLAKARPDDAILVEEAPSHRPAIQRYLPINRAGGYFTMASGGLGWGLPASVGVALGASKRTICVVGDGSSMYSFQSLWTAVQHRLPLTVVVVNNLGYGALKAFGKLMQVRSITGLDLSGIDFVQLATSLGCKGKRVEKHEDLAAALAESVSGDEPYLLEVAIDPDTGNLY